VRDHAAQPGTSRSQRYQRTARARRRGTARRHAAVSVAAHDPDHAAVGDHTAPGYRPGAPTAAGHRRRRRQSTVWCVPDSLLDRERAATCRHRRRGGARETETLVLLSLALAFSAVLFTLGVLGVLMRRNAIVIFMCVELMLNAVNLTFVALAQNLGMGGQVFVFFVMAVAAAEAAVGLAIILAVYRHRQSVSLQNMNLLKDGSTGPP